MRCLAPAGKVEASCSGIRVSISIELCCTLLRAKVECFSLMVALERCLGQPTCHSAYGINDGFTFLHYESIREGRGDVVEIVPVTWTRLAQ